MEAKRKSWIRSERNAGGATNLKKKKQTKKRELHLLHRLLK